MVLTDDFVDDDNENNVEDSPDPNPDRIGLTGITGCLGTVEYASVIVSKISTIVMTIILVILLVILLVLWGYQRKKNIKSRLKIIGYPLNPLNLLNLRIKDKFFINFIIIIPILYRTEGI